jgi:hypothetical protein
MLYSVAPCRTRKMRERGDFGGRSKGLLFGANSGLSFYDSKSSAIQKITAAEYSAAVIGFKI